MIILVGMSCAGKTTTGKVLAKILNYEFYDTDRELEKKMNSAIPLIYEYLGEKKFREEEFAVLQQIETVCGENSIIATGGGIAENSNAVSFLRKRQNVFLVDTDPEIIFQRIENKALASGNTYPQFLGKNIRTKEEARLRFFSLYRKRMTVYRDISVCSINLLKQI